MAKKNQQKTTPLQRLRSGVPRLDYILKGGFIRGGIYTISGPPGSGKTIFGNQLCHNLIELEGKVCIYLTLLAESHGKMLAHMGTMDFFLPEAINDKLFYLSGYQELKKKGLKGLIQLIRKTVKDHKASLIVIDGVQIASQYSDEEFSYDEFIHELQAYNSIMECTTLLLSPAPKPKTDHIENIIVDGVIELSYQLIGPRAVRELTVHKFRGTDFLPGKHETEITSRGLVIHPRTEIQFDSPPETDTEERGRMAFGIESLDEMLKGGIVSGTSTVLLGSPGTGKTMLGLYFLVEGAKAGQKGIYFGFYEPPPRLIQRAERMGIPLKKYIKKGLIDLMWKPPLEHNQDSLAEELLEKIKAEKIPSKRLFIDGVEGFRAAAVYPERMPRFLSAFTNQLRTLNITTLISEELELYKSEMNVPTRELASVCEGVILVRYIELNSQLKRLISIIKMRESSYDTSIREFVISDKGVKVADSFQSAENILSGHARVKNRREL